MKDLIKIVAFAAVLFGGVGLYIRYEAHPYGMGAEHPLGKFSRVDKHLTDQLNLEKSEIRSHSHWGVPATARMYRYQIPRKPREHLILLLDAAGNLRGLVAWYREYERGPALTAIGGFARGHWSVAGGASSPDFEWTGSRGDRVGHAQFTTARVTGMWQKPSGSYGSTMVNELIYLRVTTPRANPKSSPTAACPSINPRGHPMGGGLRT